MDASAIGGEIRGKSQDSQWDVLVPTLHPDLKLGVRVIYFVRV